MEKLVYYLLSEVWRIESAVQRSMLLIRPKKWTHQSVSHLGTENY